MKRHREYPKLKPNMPQTNVLFSQKAIQPVKRYFRPIIDNHTVGPALQNWVKNLTRPCSKLEHAYCLQMSFGIQKKENYSF